MISKVVIIIVLRPQYFMGHGRMRYATSRAGEENAAPKNAKKKFVDATLTPPFSILGLGLLLMTPREMSFDNARRQL